MTNHGPAYRRVTWHCQSMVSMAAWKTIALLGLLALWVGLASCQETVISDADDEPTEQELQEAKAEFEEAIAAEGRGDYVEALGRYSAAARHFPAAFGEMARIHR